MNRNSKSLLERKLSVTGLTTQFDYGYRVDGTISLIHRYTFE